MLCTATSASIRPVCSSRTYAAALRPAQHTVEPSDTRTVIVIALYSTVQYSTNVRVAAAEQRTGLSGNVCREEPLGGAFGVGAEKVQLPAARLVHETDARAHRCALGIDLRAQRYSVLFDSIPFRSVPFRVLSVSFRIKIVIQ